METLNSCLYECQVYHERLAPKNHRFKNRLFFFYLDLDELARLGSGFKLLKVGKPGFFSFQDSDYMPRFEGNLKERAIQAFQEAGLSGEIHKVFLLTHLRTLGYVFNPISLYYAMNAQGDCLGVLAQVENTFREMKLFPVLGVIGGQPDLFLSEHVKWFYVSPYSSLDQIFQFKVKAPGRAIECQVNSYEGKRALLNSGFQGKKQELSDVNLLKMALKYPLLTWQVTGLIHWHALLLWLKRVPLFLKDSDLSFQRNVLRPRTDLNRYYQGSEVNP